MELIKLEDVSQFVGVPVEVAIQDAEGSDQAPSVKKVIKKYSFVQMRHTFVFILMIFIFLPYRLLHK